MFSLQNFCIPESSHQESEEKNQLSVAACQVIKQKRYRRMRLEEKMSVKTKKTHFSGIRVILNELICSAPTS